MKNRPSWHSASKAEWKEACRREAVIRPLVVEGSVSNAQADQAAQELGVSQPVLLRHFQTAKPPASLETVALMCVKSGNNQQSKK